MEAILLRPEEAAAMLGIGRTKVYEMLGRGELPVLRIGRNVRIPRHALLGWIEAQTVVPGTALTGTLDKPAVWASVGPARGR